MLLNPKRIQKAKKLNCLHWTNTLVVQQCARLTPRLSIRKTNRVISNTADAEKNMMMKSAAGFGER